MKQFLIIAYLLTINAYVFSQVNIEGQLGGSNFLGSSLNTELEIPLTKSKKYFIAPSIGIGYLLPLVNESTFIIHSGLNFKYKNWGFGSEVSGFTGNPFSKVVYYRGFVDMLVYPNINYTKQFKSNCYLKFSAGTYLAFSRYYNSLKDEIEMNFEGDIIPGAGISFGYKFKSNSTQTN